MFALSSLVHTSIKILLGGSGASISIASMAVEPLTCFEPNFLLFSDRDTFVDWRFSTSSSQGSSLKDEEQSMKVTPICVVFRMLGDFFLIMFSIPEIAACSESLSLLSSVVFPSKIFQSTLDRPCMSPKWCLRELAFSTCVSQRGCGQMEADKKSSSSIWLSTWFINVQFRVHARSLSDAERLSSLKQKEQYPGLIKVWQYFCKPHHFDVIERMCR